MINKSYQAIFNPNQFTNKIRYEYIIAQRNLVSLTLIQVNESTSKPDILQQCRLTPAMNIYQCSHDLAPAGKTQYHLD